MEQVTAYKSNNGTNYDTEGEALHADMLYALQAVCNGINNCLPTVGQKFVTPTNLVQFRTPLIKALNATPNEGWPAELKEEA